MSHQPTGPTALVDHWYSHAVGHVIEALRRCQGYHACDPTLWIGLVLNAASPLELVRCAPLRRRDFFPCPTRASADRRGARGVPSRGIPRTETTSPPPVCE